MEGSTSSSKSITSFLVFLLISLFTLCCSSSQAQQEGAQSKDSIKAYMDTMVVTAQRLREEQPIGPYNQPEWTQVRRFPSTRVYIQTPPGSVEYEQWLEIRVPKGNSKTETRLREEFAFGLDEHIQLDIYLNTLHIRDNASSTFEFRGWSAEVRWAPGDWDQIPGNPTLYFEYLFFNGAPDKIEPKLLLGGELSSRWHWGLNLIHERELAALADRDEEFAVTAAVSYTFFDQRLSFGPVISVSTETERASGLADETMREILIGPSIQIRPHKRAFLDVEPLFGVTETSKQLKMFIVFGWDF